MVAASKAPMLKPSKYEIWRMRIKQYIQMIDYALWEELENGTTLQKTTTVEGVVTEMPITTTVEKAQRRLEDAKKLMEVVEKRFGRNATTRKTQRNLLKQQYENFTAPSLKILVYEPEVKGMSSSSSSIQNMAFVSSSNDNTSSTNGVVNTAQTVITAHGVSTASTQVYAANSTNIDNLSDAVICLFFARRKLTVNGNETIGFDKSKVGVYNFKKSRQQELGKLKKECTQEGLNYELMAFPSSSPDSEVSDDEEEDVSRHKAKKKIVRPSIVKKEFVKSKQQEKTARKTVKQVEQHRQNTHSPRGNQRNWNNMMSQKLGSNFKMFNKACYVCGSFDHLQVDCNYHQKQFQNQRMVKPVWNNTQRVNHQNFAKKTHPCAKKNLFPRAVLMKSGLVSINTTRQVNAAHSKTTVNAARPMSYLSKIAHSTIKRPIHKNTVFKNSNINQKVNTVRGKKFNTARPKAVVNAVKGNNFNTVKASAFKGGLTCLFAKATSDESKLWHRRLATKDETSGIFKSFISGIENLVDHKVKADEGFFVRYSLNSKAFRVFNSRTRIVEENLHIRFSKSTPNAIGIQSNGFAGTKASDNAGQARKKTKPIKNYILLPLWTVDPPYSQDPKSSHDDGSKPSSDDGKKVDENLRKDSECKDQEKEDNVNNTNTVNAAGTNEVNAVGGKTSIKLLFDPNIPALEDYNIFDFSRDNEDDDGAMANMNNLDTIIRVSPNLTTRTHKDHPLDQVIGDLKTATQTRKMSKNLKEHGFEEPKKAIGSKWVFKNKKDEKGIVIRNKARLVAQGYTQEEGIDYDEVFALIARIEAIRLFLAYASFKEFVVYQMDAKVLFSMRRLKKRCMYVNHQDLKIQTFLIEYTRLKALYGLHQSSRAWYETLSTYLLDNGFPRGKIDKILFIKRHKGDILLVQVYVDDIIFGSTKKELCIAFEKLMNEKFQMSSMGELTFFLGLQVQQKKDGIFISKF
ncbi:putative ribonuclease H-like domain-containing protein [Tanacetum coccineum]|uniref:Ribonuclease H-like domain-containing protein n=1 Tax=Tanacetum coccineum TaxID=301880 RepID=A0ABQ5F3J1_9ASTR